MQARLEARAAAAGAAPPFVPFRLGSWWLRGKQPLGPVPSLCPSKSVEQEDLDIHLDCNASQLEPSAKETSIAELSAEPAAPAKLPDPISSTDRARQIGSKCCEGPGVAVQLF